MIFSEQSVTKKVDQYIDIKNFIDSFQNVYNIIIPARYKVFGCYFNRYSMQYTGRGNNYYEDLVKLFSHVNFSLSKKINIITDNQGNELFFGSGTAKENTTRQNLMSYIDKNELDITVYTVNPKSCSLNSYLSNHHQNEKSL